jgi:exopolysaccharide biosynthesis polyprenyl glycosylphosphotransferase
MHWVSVQGGTVRDFTTSVKWRRRDMAQSFLLVTFDAFAMYEALVLAYVLRSSEDKSASGTSAAAFRNIAFGLTPFWMLVFAAVGLYSVRYDRGRLNEICRVVFAVSGGAMLLIVESYLRPHGAVFQGRSVPVFAVGLGIPFVVLSRQFVRLSMRLLYATGRGLHDVVLVGTGELAQRVGASLRRSGSGYRIVGVVSAEHDGDTFLGDVPIYPNLEAALAAHSMVDEIVQAEVELHRSEITRMMALAGRRGVSYRFVPDLYGVYAAASTLATLDGLPLMEVRLTSLDGWPAIGKRLLDLVGSLVLIGLLAPLMAVIAVACKVGDPTGPILYRQRRLGIGGREIDVMKFRSMRWQYSTGLGRPYASAIEAFQAMDRADLAEEFARNHKVANDPRVSAVGKWLRRTSLDELPQLFNALRGDVSLVGPRPITEAELERYGNQRASFLALKPGITGLWQVSGRSDTGYDERVKLDVFYAEHWSLGLDLSILAKTLVTVAGRKGAY